MAEEKSMPKNYVCTVNDAQRIQIENYCREHGWQFSDLAYGHWKAAGNKINVAAYKSKRFRPARCNYRI